MHEILVAGAIFVCLVVAALGCLVLSAKLPEHHRNDDTYNVVRLAANIFVVMTSLVLGLLINSSKNTFEAIDRNVHAFSTDLILLDRSLRQYGPESADVRDRLALYLRRGIEGTWGADGASVLEDRTAESLLDDVAVAPGDTAPRSRAPRAVARSPH